MTIDEMKKDMAEWGLDQNQINNALEIIYIIGVGQDLAWRDGEGIIRSDVSINKRLWDYLKQGYILEGLSRYGRYGIYILGDGGEEIFQEMLELKSKSNIKEYKNEFININPKIFAILSPPLRRNIDRLNVKEEFAVLFLNSKKGNELKYLLNNKINFLYSLLKKYNLYLELTPFQSNCKGGSKSKFINNNEVHRLLLDGIESFPASFYDPIIELNKKVSFFNDLVNSIENYKIRDKINNEYSNYFNECKELIDKLKEEKITTSFDSSNPPYFKIKDEQKFKNKIEKMKHEYIDEVSNPIISYLMDEEITEPDKPKRPDNDKTKKSEEKGKPEGEEQTDKDNLRIYLGKSEDNKSIYWEPDGTKDKPRMVSGNILINGGAGSGKTETLKSILYELNNMGYICLALGFHPDLTIEGFKYTQITAKSNIGINPLDFDSLDEDGGGLPIQVYNVVERLKNTYPTIGDIQESNLIEILEEAYKTKGISESKETWKKTCPNFEDIEKILNDKISQTNDKDLIRLKNKLSKIFKFNIFSKKESIDFNELFQKSTILDLSKLPDDFLFLVSDTILRKMYRNLKLRNPIEYNAKGKERFRIFIAIDEAKILVPSNKGDTKAIINILGTEARKFGVGFIVSSQLTSHFGDDVLGNMATKIALKPLKHNIAKDNAKELSIDPQDLMNIKNPGEGFIRFSNEETKKIFLKSYEEKVKD